MSQTPLILVCNDDSIISPGIKTLVNVMSKIGKVVVVAPDSPQSGMGHAITINHPLRLSKTDNFGDKIESYQCSGTPADCVKLAVDKVLHQKPDLLVSGINHGSNSSINVIYSGTMSAAVEGAIEGINAIGFSLLDYSWEANFSHCEKYVERICRSVLEHKLPDGVLLNVNFPKTEIKGLKVCRQARARWAENFDERLDPSNRKYYWLTGEFYNLDHGEDTDEWALAHGYGSVVPVQFDMTAHHAISKLNNWNLSNES